MKSRPLTAHDFLPSLKGRGRRIPFIVLTIAWYVAFVGLVMLWSAQSDNTPWRIGLHILTLMIFPLKFCIAGRRLHDLNLSLLFGSHLLVLTATGFYNNYAVTYLHAPFWSGGSTFHVFGHGVSQWTLAGIALVCITLILDLALMIVPGTRGPNRYGPDPRALTDQSMSEVF